MCVLLAESKVTKENITAYTTIERKTFEHMHSDFTMHTRPTTIHVHQHDDATVFAWQV